MDAIKEKGAHRGRERSAASLAEGWSARTRTGKHTRLPTTWPRFIVRTELKTGRAYCWERSENETQSRKCIWLFEQVSMLLRRSLSRGSGKSRGPGAASPHHTHTQGGTKV